MRFITFALEMKKSFLTFVFLLSIFSLFGQGKGSRFVMKNLQEFDKARFHFGFILGWNSSDFFIDEKQNNYVDNNLLSLNNISRPGFNLGIVSSLNITHLTSIRFLPTLSFQERELQYNFSGANDTSVLWTKRIESTFLDFPLLLKMRTERINNFAAYIVAGGRFGLDMQSNKDVNNGSASLKEQIVKITKPDYGIEVGGGFDFFLEYFKLGIELKMGMGLKNILIQENTYFSNPIDKLRSKVWTVSLTFEG
jgi:hypothetical protein